MRGKVLSLLAAILAATALASASGAGTARSTRFAQTDLSSRSAVIHYLRSIHVKTAGVVVQRGLRNYAGAHCPGKGWSCTSTTHPVVQVARFGGVNTFRCGTASCAVVQVATSAASTNTAKCIKISILSQSCTINQSSSSGNNVAIVYQAAVGAIARTQTALVSASITQTATGASNTNTACVSQNVLMDGSTVALQPVTVSLEAHQTVTVTQDSSSGGNFAQSSATVLGTCDTGHPLTQGQLLNSIVGGGGAVTQNENASNGGANMTIDIEQNQSPGFKCTGPTTCPSSGPNGANFSQTNTLTAVADSKNGPISQTQSSVNGGLLGTINQDSSGVSTANATQKETQCEDAAKSGLVKCDTNDGDAGQAPAVLTQTQFGPVHKGVGEATQTGNGGDMFTVTQSSTQNNDQGAGSNQTNVVQGDCHTPGSCTVTQDTNINGQQNTNTQSGQDVDTTTNCTGSTCTTPEIVFDDSAGTGRPPETLGGYPMTPFGADSQATCDSEGSFVNSVNDPVAGRIGFSESLHHAVVPTCWATWSNGYTGDVYDTASGSTDPTSVTITLQPGTQAFYLYAEPQQFLALTIQATAQDGTTSGPIVVQGEGGAQYFGFYGVGGATVSSITITSADPTGFAIGEFGISPGAPIVLQ